MQDDFPEYEPVEEFSKLQENFLPNEDTAEITKEASSGAFNLSHALADSPNSAIFANSPLIGNEIECRRLIKDLLEEEPPLSYVELEKYLHDLSFPILTIRKNFKAVTGIDPDRSFLDFASYQVPPESVPRFNYGWGEAKSGSGYFFILPWIHKFGVFQQQGLDRKLVSEFDLVAEAQDDLEKRIKQVKHVTPDTAQIVYDIIQRTANLSKLSSAGTDIYVEAKRLFEFDPNQVAKFIYQAYDAGRINDVDLKIIAANIVLADSASEGVDQDEFDKFRKDQENRSFKEIKENVQIPGQALNENWANSHKVDFWGLLTESRELFQQICGSLSNYRIDPDWGNFQIMPQPALSLGEDDQILDGSVAVGATAQKLGTDEESAIAILFFIQNGKLRYNGKFRGINNRDYGFSELGLDEFFNDLEGQNSTKLDYKLPSSPNQESMSAVRPRPQ